VIHKVERLTLRTRQVGDDEVILVVFNVMVTAPDQFASAVKTFDIHLDIYPNTFSAAFLAATASTNVLYVPSAVNLPA